MDESSQFLMTVGGILLLGLMVSVIAHRSFLPRVTLLLIFGMIIGSEGVSLIPEIFSDRFEIIADMTLLMVGFLLGGRLTKKSLSGLEFTVMWVSLSAAILTAVIVCSGLIWAGVSIEIAILLGCIASATAPAAILDVVNETGIKNKFSDLLLSVVALDDVWALMLFAIGMSLVKALNGHAGEVVFVIDAVKEIAGAMLLGGLIAIPASYLTGRVKKGQPILTEALGIVFMCGGLAIWLNVSYLIAAIVMGMVIANFAKHHEYPFHAIEGIERPFMVIFFVLAGASLNFASLWEIGVLGAIYVISRIAGKYLGARVGAALGNADTVTRQWMGGALLPQAGVAIGMALVASNQYPEYKQTLLSIVISSTVFFEIVGPVFTRLALKRSL